MPTARKHIIDLSNPGWTHCTNRCVRHAYLCGQDHRTGQKFDHRKDWLEHRLDRVAKHFAVEVAAFAIMSNHFHIVCRMNPELLSSCTDEEIAHRYASIYPGFREKIPNQRSRADDAHYATRVQNVKMKILSDPNAISLAKERLSSLSWFMAALTEPISRWANKEEEITGRFWEGRYHVSPIVDEEGLIASMAYVDLNPIRAGIAKTPEGSDFTSIQERHRRLAAKQLQGSQESRKVKWPWLKTVQEITAYDKKDNLGGIDEISYLQIVEFTGKYLSNHKPVKLDNKLPPLLERLTTQKEQWIQHMRSPGSMTGCIGLPHNRALYARRQGKAFTRTSCSLLN